MDRLFISVKDRPQELAILCKSLIHSDMRFFINDVIFLDDHSEEKEAMQRIYSAFSYAMVPLGIHTRWLDAKDGRSGINESWDRIKYYKCDRIWMLNGDMMVFSNYFRKCSDLLEFGGKEIDWHVIVSGFNTWLHPPVKKFPKQKAIKVSNVGGCSLVLYWDNLSSLLECLGRPTMNRGFDLHLGELFDNILVTDPSQSQHIGIFSGLNQLYLANFPGAWANIDP